MAVDLSLGIHLIGQWREHKCHPVAAVRCVGTLQLAAICGILRPPQWR
jgi:hypothetical protein